jgi:hypothetical protein
MKRNIAILILIFVCLINTSYSQTKTPYEKKVDQIMIDMCKVIGVDNSLLQMAIKLNDWDIVRTSQDFAFKCKMLDRNELLVIILATEQKLKEAKKLKTDVDYRKEQEKETKEKRLKEQELNKKLVSFSDIEKVKTEVKTEFLKWVKKGEFETNSDYQIRTKNKAAVIDSITFELITSRINSLTQKNCTNSDEISYYLELKNYDTEKQIYNVEFVCRAHTGFTHCGGYQNIDEKFSDILNIDIELAKKIKQVSKKDKFFTNSDADIIWFCNRKIIYTKNLNDWIITPNGYFFPNKLEFYNEIIHINNQNIIPLIKLSLNTKDLGLQEYFNENYNINIQQVIVKKLEIQRNILITQAEKLVSENNLEQAIKFFKDANQIQNTEDIKIKVVEIEKKIIEKKQNDLIKSAEQSERDGSITNSLEKLEEAKELFIEANKLIYNENLQFKIVEIQNKITEIKQNELLKKAEQYEQVGEITNSIEKLEEANKLKFSTSISSKIDFLIKGRDLALSNHKYLDSLYILAQLEELNLFKDIVSTNSLDEIKKGYGQKYLDCKSLITTKINSIWLNVSNTNNEINKNRNREVWNDKFQELLLQIKEFRNEINKNSDFEINIQKALLENDKKQLKILKEDDLKIIIDTILSNNYIKK